MTIALPKAPEDWRKAFDALPTKPAKIPAFFFGHGSPMLQASENMLAGRGPIGDYSGPNGPLGRFLKEFGPTLLGQYQPTAILVFSRPSQSRLNNANLATQLLHRCPLGDQ